MALTIAIPNTTTVDKATANKSTKQWSPIYTEKFASSATIEKVIVCDPRRNKALQIKGNGVDTFIISTTIHPGVGVTSWLDAAVPWIVSRASSFADYQSGGGAINKEVWAIKIVSVELTDDVEISCTQMPDNE